MTTPKPPAKNVAPLDWRTPIVDKGGLPTPEFQRRWLTQAEYNAAVPDLSVVSVEAGTGLTGGGTLNNSPVVLSADAQAILNEITPTPGSLLLRGPAKWLGLPAPADATTFLNGGTTPAYAPVTDTALSLSDVVANNVTTVRHGFVPRAPGDATKFLAGNGAWATPAGGGGGVATYVGAGAPVAFHNTGDVYFDNTQTPYQGYVQIAVQGPATPPQVDGNPAINNTWQNVASSTISVTTSAQSQLLIVSAFWQGVNPAQVTSISSTSGLVFTRLFINTGLGNSTTTTYSAPLSAALNAETITINLSANIDTAEIIAFGVKGLHPSYFDTNTSFPASDANLNHSTMSVTGATDNAQDLAIFVQGITRNDPGGDPAGFSFLAKAVNAGGFLSSTLSITSKVLANPTSSTTYTSGFVDTNHGAAIGMFVLRPPGSAPTPAWSEFGSPGGGGGGGSSTGEIFLPPAQAYFPLTFDAGAGITTSFSPTYGLLASVPNGKTGDTAPFIAKAVTNTTWAATARLRQNVSGANFIGSGIVIYSQSSNRLLIFGTVFNNIPNLVVSQLAYPNGFNGSVNLDPDWGGSEWLKVAFDGTNFVFSTSREGFFWRANGSTTVGNWLNGSPTHIGVGFDLNFGTSAPQTVVCTYWQDNA